MQLAPGADDGALAAAGLVVVREISRPLRIVQVRGRGGEDGLDVAARLAHTRQAGIAGAIPDLALPHAKHGSAFTPPPNDPRLSGQWFWERIGLYDAWSRETGSAATTVVVIDDGCDLAHPDLVDQLDPGTDANGMDADPSYLPGVSGNNHGTSCAGLVAARTNNGLGVAGACPGCRLRCVRLLGKDGDPIPVSADLAAFQFAYDVGAAVVSNSWGYTSAVPVPDMVRQVVEKLYDDGRGGLGAVVVFAAGNDDRELGGEEINAVRGVVTVGATNNFDELTAYSNFGPSVAVVAPTGTLTTDISGAEGSDPGDYVSTFSGTSSACPIVAGVFGLLASAAPDRRAPALVEALVGSARQSKFASPDATGHDDYYGHGGIRPLDALRLLAGETLDGGIADGAGGDGGTAPSDGGCGCALGGAAPAWPAAGLLAFVMLVWARRRLMR